MSLCQLQAAAVVAVVGPGAGVGSVGGVYLELDNHPELQAGLMTSHTDQLLVTPSVLGGATCVINVISFCNRNGSSAAGTHPQPDGSFHRISWI